VQVVPALPPADPYVPFGRLDVDYSDDVRAAEEYLRGIAAHLPGEVHTLACAGGVIDTLVELAGTSSISHIVLASHGRTALPRVILGSVADMLIHRLHCPIVVIPALAAGTVVERAIASKEPAGSAR
jgi:nucleotide-binding universal stress UspA family protein